MMSASVGWLLGTDPSLSLVLCKVLFLRELLFTEQFRLFFVLTALWFPLAPSQKSPHLLIGILVNNSKPIHWGYFWPALQDRNAILMAQCWHVSGNACTHLCSCMLHTACAPLRTCDAPHCSPNHNYDGGESIIIPSIAENLLGRKTCWLSVEQDFQVCVHWLFRDLTMKNPNQFSQLGFWCCCFNY